MLLWNLEDRPSHRAEEQWQGLGERGRPTSTNPNGSPVLVGLQIRSSQVVSSTGSDNCTFFWATGSAQVREVPRDMVDGAIGLLLLQG